MSLAPAEQEWVHAIVQRLAVAAGGLKVFHPGSPQAQFNNDPRLIDPLTALLRRWLIHPHGYVVVARVRSTAAPSTAALARVAEDVFGGLPVEIDRGSDNEADAGQSFAHALHPAVGVPALLPAADAAARLGIAQHFDPPACGVPTRGTVFGSSSAGPASTPVALPAQVRTLHTAVVGATGSGKSSLLLRMILEEIRRPAAGCGVGLIDPHGDLCDRVLQAIPSAHADRVVLIDVTDAGHCVSINPLEGMACDATAAHRIANQIGDIVDCLLEGHDTTGPIARSHLRHALLLAAARPGAPATLLDLTRALEDKAVFERLLQQCTNRALRDYWKRAREAYGEQSLANWLPYLIARLTPFVANPVLRRLFCRPRSTVNLRQAFEERRIVLCNLSKSVLQDNECRVAGALMLMMFHNAALSRAGLPAKQRTPFHLYVDEFASLANDGTPRMFAEARKYGLALTVAMQGTAGLRHPGNRTPLADSVFANTGSKFIFRLGVEDAGVLAPYFMPAVGVADIVRLPDRHAVFSLAGGGRPLPPFVVRVASPERASAAAAASSIRARSNARYATTLPNADAALAEAYDASLTAVAAATERAAE
jgi:hypothetical protein